MIFSRRVVRPKSGKKGTERRERCVNNLHSDESIVLRRAHATAPIMALRLAKASTELLHSHPLRVRILHQAPPALFWSLRSPSSFRYLPTPFSSCTVFSRLLALFSTDITKILFHYEKFNYNCNYHSEKVLLANARYLTIVMIRSFAIVVLSCEWEMRIFRRT